MHRAYDTLYRPSHLDETDVSSLLTEALAADVQPILANDTVVIAADAAVGTNVR